MSGCGCGGGEAPWTPTDREGRRERAAICRVCPDALYHGFGAIGCTVSGKAIEDHLYGDPCPVGRLPGPDGLVNWCGMTLYGVPWPARLWARLTAPTRPGLGTWRGCGCWRWAKDLWVKMTSSSEPHPPPS